MSKSDRFHNLVSCAPLSAMVAGKGEEVELFYLHAGDCDDRLKAANERGMRSIGVIGVPRQERRASPARIPSPAERCVEIACIHAVKTSPVCRGHLWA
jgi:hypothetical protein